jgi:glycerol-3-phosphate acyltransferase PlsY
MTPEGGIGVILALGLLAYLLGSIPFGLLLTHAAGLGDIRRVGSGNIGATNVLRTGRKGLAVTTLLLDGAKGAVAVLIARRLGNEVAVGLAGVLAVVGHVFPVWLGFKGGKGVATGFGVLLAASPITGLGCGVVWLAVVFNWRISSAGALAAFAAAPVIAAFIGPPLPVYLMIAAIAALIWQRHTANIVRLVAGTEPRIGKRT